MDAGSPLRRPIPVARSILWAPPLGGGVRPAEIPFPIFLSQVALTAISEHVATPLRAGQGVLGFLLGDLCECPETNVSYLVIDAALRLNQAIHGDRSRDVVTRLWDKIEAQLAEQQAHLIGWYHTHAPLPLTLSDHDVETHEHYFAEPWQVAMLLATDPAEPAGAFFRAGADEWVATPLPFYELLSDDSIRPGGKKRSFVTWKNYRAYNPVVPQAAPPRAAAQPEPEPEPEPEPTPEPPPPSRPPSSPPRPVRREERTTELQFLTTAEDFATPTPTPGHPPPHASSSGTRTPRSSRAAQVPEPEPELEPEAEPEPESEPESEPEPEPEPEQEQDQEQEEPLAEAPGVEPTAYETGADASAWPAEEYTSQQYASEEYASQGEVTQWEEQVEPEAYPPPVAPAPKKRRRRRHWPWRRWLMRLSVLMLVAGAAGAYWWFQPTLPSLTVPRGVKDFAARVAALPARLKEAVTEARARPPRPRAAPPSRPPSDRQPAPTTAAPPPSPAPVTAAPAPPSPLGRLDRVGDSLALVVRGFNAGAAQFARGQLACVGLAHALGAVEQRWTAYTAARRAAGVLDATHAARDQSLYAGVDSVEHRFDKSGCERP